MYKDKNLSIANSDDIKTTAENSQVSRRDLFKQAATVVGIATATAITTPLRVEAAPPKNKSAQSKKVQTIPQYEARETLTAQEMATLEAVCDRLVPADKLGPGAREARVPRYIDRSLAGPLKELKDKYSICLAAIDEYSKTKKNKIFTKLPPVDQDEILTDIEKGVPTAGFVPKSNIFFNMMLAHVHQGMFSDPFYGGNANFIGWDLIRYPGLRMHVSAEDQKLNAKPKPLRESAYDISMFQNHEGRNHGK